MLLLAVKTSQRAMGKGKREKELEKEREKEKADRSTVCCVYMCFVKSESLSRNDIQERK